MEKRVIRLNKVLGELNISLDRAVEHLKAKGFAIELSPNAKITDEEYNVLNKQFSADKGKNEANISVREEKNREKELLRLERQNELAEEKRKKEIQIQLVNEKIKLKNNISLEDYRKDIVKQVSTIINIDQVIVESYINSNYKELNFDNKVKFKKFTNNIKNFFGNKPIAIIETEKVLDTVIYPWFENIPNNVCYFKLGNNFKVLYLSQCEVSIDKLNLDIWFVLTIVNCKLTEIINFNPVSNLLSLTISGCNLKDIDFLEYFPKLKDIDLSDNNISDISVFEKFDILYELNLANNFILDISPLNSLKVYEKLFLDNNLIIDLSPLYFSLKTRKISDLAFTNNQNLIYPPYKEQSFSKEYVIEWFDNVYHNVKSIFDEAKLVESKTLDLGFCGLTDLNIISDLFFENDYIEELILSNEYCEYDVENLVFFRKLSTRSNASFNYPNAISQIPLSIGKFIRLKKLVIGGNWQEGTIYKKFLFTDIESLIFLQNLEELNISNGVLESLRGIENLKNIRTLYANNNELLSISELSNNTKLEHLYIGNNKIQDLKSIENFKKLKTLDFHSNEVSDIKPLNLLFKKTRTVDAKWTKNAINIYNNPLDEVFVNIVRKSENTLDSEDFRNYLKRLFSSNTKTINQVKLILLGNTRCGKTTLSDIITKNNLADNGSTHGLNFFKNEINNIDIRGFDFGGQDYYHNTHFAFFNELSLYLFIWGNNQENKFEIDKKDENLYPLNYWLGALNEFRYKLLLDSFYNTLIKRLDLSINIDDINDKLRNNNFPIIEKDYEKKLIEFKDNNTLSFFNLKKRVNAILLELSLDIENEDKIDGYVIQNVCDKKKFINEYDIHLDYDFIDDFKTFNFKQQEEQLLAYLKQVFEEKKKKIVKPELDYIVAEKFEKDSQIIYNISELKNSYQEFENLVFSEIDSLLNGLHSILSCYYFKPNEYEILDEEFVQLEDIVITNIQEFTNWIHKIFESKENKEKIRSSKNNGYFSKSEAIEWLENNNVAINHIDYILAFMLANKIIFKVKNTDRFFAPNYLSESLTTSEELLFNSFRVPIIKYEFSSFFHTSILSDIISEFLKHIVYNNDSLRYLSWKNIVLLYDEMKSRDLFKLEFNCNGEVPSITLSTNNKYFNKDFINKLSDFIELKIKFYDYNKLLLARNGDYVDYESIWQSNLKQQNIFSYENKFYTVTEFSNIIDNIKLKMKKIFISYSKDDLEYVNEFLNHLSPLKRDGLISTWYCTELVAGGKWNEDISRNFEQSDIIIFFVSPNLLKTDYVYNCEIKKAFEKKEKDPNFKIVPVILDYCSWITKDYNLGDFSALPYTAKPIRDFKDRNMAYFIIVESLKYMIEIDKQLLGDDWFNDKEHSSKISKQVLRIYERIVKGEVDR